MRILFFLAIFIVLPCALRAQWNNSGNNYTTGNLGIGITNPGHPFHLEFSGDGTAALISSNIKLNRIPSLEELQTYINQNKQLPEGPLTKRWRMVLLC